MKKLTGFIMMILLCVGLLVGCGQSYDAETSTVFVLKDGKIVSTDVETFDENTYDKAGLESYIKDAVDAYTAENGKDSVELKRLEVADGKAVLQLSYASAADYAKFNGIELYTGSVSQAMAAGYSFDVDFAAVTDGKAVSCDVNDFLGGDYKVVIIKGNTNVNVAGSVAYLSVKNTTYVDKNTVAIQEGASLLGEAMADSEMEQSTEPETESGTETESGEAQVSEESIGDDDLLSASEEDSQVVFEFEEDEPADDSQTGEFSEVYTYIIYK